MQDSQVMVVKGYTEGGFRFPCFETNNALKKKDGTFITCEDIKYVEDTSDWVVLDNNGAYADVGAAVFELAAQSRARKEQEMLALRARNAEAAKRNANAAELSPESKVEAGKQE